MRTKINLDVTGRAIGRHIAYVGGAVPYLWIGGKMCYGCVPDADVEALRAMCEAVLKARIASDKKAA